MPCIRLARHADIAALQALIAMSGRTLSAGFYTPRQAGAITEHVFGVDTQLIDDGTYFVAQDGHKLVACGGWGKRNTLFGGDQTKHGPDPLLDPTTQAARIRAFFVAPECARRGIGRRLLDACIDDIRHNGFRMMELVSTLPGQPLYAASGFKVVEPFDLVLPGDIHVPVVRMRRSVD